MTSVASSFRALAMGLLMTGPVGTARREARPSIHSSIARVEGRSGKTKTVAMPALCRVPVPSRKFFKASRRAPTSPGRFCVPHHTDNTLDGEINP
jgi:hypothetical protein